MIFVFLQQGTNQTKLYVAQTNLTARLSAHLTCSSLTFSNMLSVYILQRRMSPGIVISSTRSTEASHGVGVEREIGVIWPASEVVGLEN